MKEEKEKKKNEANLTNRSVGLLTKKQMKIFFLEQFCFQNSQYFLFFLLDFKLSLCHICHHYSSV